MIQDTGRVRLLLGTLNSGKATEIAETLAGLGLELLMPQDVKIFEGPEETGITFAENATIKARFFHERSGLPTIADDSGIIVEALEGELGLHTRRWGAGPQANDQEWIEFFLRRMQKEKNKRAHFVCALCSIDAKGNEQRFEGHCDGIITESLEADYIPGLPISACFRPDGYDRVFSALSIADKNAVSHRGRATHALRQYLHDQLLHR